jgi:hypothetical protein
MFPLLGAMRYPIKFVTPSIMVAPLLATIGLATLFDSERAKPSLRAFFATSGALSVVAVALAWYSATHPLPEGKDVPVLSNGLTRVALLGLFVGAVVMLGRARDRSREMIFGILLLTLIWTDNRTHVPKLNPTVARNVYQPGMVRDYLKLNDPSVHGHSRIMPSYESLVELQHRTVSTAQDEVIGRRLALSGNLNLLDGFSKANGFFALYPREVWDFHWLLFSEEQKDIDPLKDLFCVAYITAPKTLMDWKRRDTALPMVTSGQQPIFADNTNTLRGLGSRTFEPKKFVYLPIIEALTVITNPGAARIMDSTFTAHRAKINVEAATPSLALIAQSYYHHWRAAIDGTPTQLLRADHALQAVLVPPGKHQITLSYHDTMFTCGLVISLLTLGICGTALIWWSVRDRHGRVRTTPRSTDA